MPVRLATRHTQAHHRTAAAAQYSACHSLWEQCYRVTEQITGGDGRCTAVVTATNQPKSPPHPVPAPEFRQIVGWWVEWNQVQRPAPTQAESNEFGRGLSSTEGKKKKKGQQK